MSKTNIDPKAVDELLSRGVEEVIVDKHLRERLLSGEVLRIKLGIDPTSPHLHLGHTVPLRKMRQFQDLGHQAVLIIGDATAEIGDPTGRTEARQRLSREKIDENKKTYLEQAAKILDIEKLEVRHNGEWFFPMSAAEMLSLTSLVSLQQVLQREDFRKRVDDPEHPLSTLEILYPVMQGYDSVMVKSDVELGGVDQKLNVLFGRRMQRHFDLSEQDVLLVPLLIGTDGERKMSKSFDNAIFLESEPDEKFGKVMSIPDNLIVNYFTLLTSFSSEEIEAVRKENENPRDQKAQLAFEIVKIFHSESEAKIARENFDKQFRDKEIPDEMPELKISAPINIIDLLVQSQLAPSKGEARRLIDGGGVKVAGQAVENYEFLVEPTVEGVVIQKGKRGFVRVF